MGFALVLPGWPGRCGFALSMFRLRGGWDTVLPLSIFCAAGRYGFALSMFRPPGVRQPSLSLRHSLRPDGPSGCALRGAAVLVAASLPRRPGLRSLLSAPDASSKPSPVRAYIFPKDRLRLLLKGYSGSLMKQKWAVMLFWHLKRRGK
ncbi:hypothetical protein A6A26_07545 [Pantoea sp. OXWO6B1]|nr:hypothetical protein A6A26_07545 [Pantoea sp. OXWO6B1]